MKIVVSAIAAISFLAISLSASSFANRYDGKGRDVAHYNSKKPPAAKKGTSH
jgi:hypothetical protein